MPSGSELSAAGTPSSLSCISLFSQPLFAAIFEMSATTPTSDNQVTIGIDFGTTGCSVGVLPESGTPDIIANEEGNRTTSSIIAFTHEELLIGGESALAQWVNNAKNTVFH